MHLKRIFFRPGWLLLLLATAVFGVAVTNAGARVIVVPGGSVRPRPPGITPRHPVTVKVVTPLDEKLEDILPVNVNTADAATLMKVPGISRKAARQIVNHRDRNGAYTSLEQLKGFSGIGESNIVRLRKYLVLE